jgi:uncharacterized protein
MKTTLKYLLIIIILSLPIARARCQFPGQPPMISVSGSAEVKVAPDEVYLKVGVETRNAFLENAKHDNDEAVSNALVFLKNSGVQDKDVQTDFISINPGYNDSSSTRIIYYAVRRSVEVKLDKVGDFEDILTGLLGHGVNSVQGIDFRTSELRKYRDQARAMAVKAAKEKAEAMASELGVKVGKVYNVNVNDYGGWWSGMGYWGGGFGGGYQNSVQNAGEAPTDEGALSTGEISVSASVNVSFLIE